MTVLSLLEATEWKEEISSTVFLRPSEVVTGVGRGRERGSPLLFWAIYLSWGRKSTAGQHYGARWGLTPH